MNMKSLQNNKSPSKNSISNLTHQDIHNINLNSNTKIDNKEISLYVKIKSDKHDDWNKELKIQINAQFGSISILILDEQDPCFYYKSIITESDYHVLKQSQNFLVDYYQFPIKVIELLELCKENDFIMNNNNISILKGTSIFQCSIEERQEYDSILSIQEISHFKCSDYLKLNLKLPSDMVLKKHLSQLSLDYKRRSEQLVDEISILKARFEEAEGKIVSLKDENKELKSRFDIELQNYDLKYEKIYIEKESNYKKDIELLKNKHFDEMSRLNKENTEKQLELEERYKNAVRLNEELLGKNSKLTVENKELSYSNEILLKENQFLKEEYEKVKNENKELTLIKYSSEKEISQLTYKVTSLGDSLNEKEQNNKILNSLVDSLKASLLELEGKNKYLKEKVEVSISEIDKGKKILEQKNMKIQKQKTTLDQRQVSLRTQNNTIIQLNNQILELNKKIDNALLDLKSKEEEVILLKASLNEEVKKRECLVDEKEKTEGALRYISQKYNDANAPLSNLLAKSDVEYGNFNKGAGLGGVKKWESNEKINNQVMNNNNTNTNMNFMSTYKYDHSDFIMPYTQFSKKKDDENNQYIKNDSRLDSKYNDKFII